MQRERLEEVQGELENPDVWNDRENARRLGKERARLEGIVDTVVKLDEGLAEARDLLELAGDEDDAETASAVEADIAGLDKHLAGLEFRRMFGGELDSSNAFLDIQSGSGGTEAQDWAEMLLRMYLRWGERRGFNTELIEVSSAEVAGIKSARFRAALRPDTTWDLVMDRSLDGIIGVTGRNDGLIVMSAKFIMDLERI